MFISICATKFAVKLFIMLLAVSLLGFGQGVCADVAGPGWLNVTGKQVSLDAAESYYSAKAQRSVERLSTSEAVSSATNITPEITELARGLRHDPKQIYDYVHNHIEYVPYFGSTKGATLTQLDASGNDFDQASLMIALLRDSGYIARYKYGTQRFSIPSGVFELDRWLGTLNIEELLDDAGIPYEFVKDTGGQPVAVDITRVWVEATIEGSDYVFDPAYKDHVLREKLDIGQMMGYDRSQLLTAVGGTGNSDYIQSLNESGLNAKLVEYSNNLADAIRRDYPNREIEDVLGRRSILKTTLTAYQTSLHHPTTVSATWDEIPAQFAATLRIQHVGIDQTIQTSELRGRRLSVTYAGDDHHPELRLDGELLSSGSGTTLGRTNDLILTVDHPYADDDGTSGDQSSTYKYKSGATYAIIYGFGGTSESLIAKRQQKLDEYRASGLANDSEPVRGETLNVMGLMWIKQTRLADDLLSDISDVIKIPHHRIGRMSQEDSYYVDVATSMSSFVPRSEGESLSPFYSGTFIGSALEHGVLEQTMGIDVPGVSTIKIIQINNSLSKKIFWATKGNFSPTPPSPSSIRTQLAGHYLAEQLDTIQSDLESGRVSVYVLPQDGNTVLKDWTGAGYIQKASNSIGMIISGGLHGGYGSLPGFVAPQTLLDNTWWNVNRSDVACYYHEYSSDPVEMSSGAFTHDKTDLTLGGSPPTGIPFARSYNSARNMSTRTMGYGWAHSLDVYLDRLTHVEPGLGGRLPMDATPVITALYISLDLLKNEDNIKGWATTALVGNWAVDRLRRNVVQVHQGGSVLEYVKLADGTYQSPPGETTQLLDNGNNTFSLVERFGTRTDFDGSDRVASVTDVDGNRMTFTYTGDDLTGVRDAANRTLTLAYNDGRVSSVTDSEGRHVSYSYDASGDLVGYVDANSKAWSHCYDSQHRMTSLTNPLGITTAQNIYDSLGRVATQTTPRQGGISATYSLYFSGFTGVEEDPLGNKTTYCYDKLGRLIEKKDALGHITRQSYDGQNHIISSTDARGYTTTHIYDGKHNRTKTTDPLGKETIFSYDAQSRMISMTDPLDHTTTYAYDSEHHPIATADAEGNTVGSTYYPNGLKKTTTDARAVTTYLAYDVFNNPATTRVSDHPTVAYSYDPIGRMTQLTDQVGSSTHFLYDPLGFTLRKTDPLGRSTLSVPDDAGQLSRVTDRNGSTTEYTYTPTGKVEETRLPGGSVIRYAYDLRDNLIAVRDASGDKVYAYDEMNRIRSLTDLYGFVVTYAYDEVGNLTAITYPGNKTITCAYDQLSRLMTVTNWLNQMAVYNYDEAGRLISVVNFNGTATTYSYDKANRLTALENAKSDGTVIASYVFTLDGNGNRIEIDQREPLLPAPAPESASYTYNAERNRLMSAGSTNFDWDMEGQLATAGGVSYSFDALHRLTSVSGATPAQYLYDAQNHRLEANYSGSVRRFVYDAAGNVIAEADAANSITAYYIYGKGLLARVAPDGSTLCYHPNGIGSTIGMTDQNQNLANRYAYDSFGHVVDQIETVAQPFRFVGAHGVMTEPDGVCYMRARYYDPRTGRFISEDPKGLEAGTNLFAYAANLPTGLVDPDGNIAFLAFGAAALIGGFTNSIPLIVHDIRTGSFSGWEYAGTFGAGALAGMAVLTPGIGWVAPSLISGAGTSVATQTIRIGQGKQESYDWASMAVDTTVGFIAGYPDGTKMPGRYPSKSLSSAFGGKHAKEWWKDGLFGAGIGIATQK